LNTFNKHLFQRELIPVRSIVTLQGASIDQYGRTLAEIVDNKGQNINKKMAELGMGVYYPFQAGCLEYRGLSEQAKAKKVGVYSDPKFELPWDYRRRVGIGKYGNATTTTAKPR
jgi:endonuclease YncB( thermonuclease family)